MRVDALAPAKFLALPSLTDGQAGPPRLRWCSCSPPQLESFLQRIIQQLPGMSATAHATLDGLTGESLIHWIHRL